MEKKKFVRKQERFVLFLMLLLLFPLGALAQQKLIKGQVVDEMGEPIIGATVMVKGVTEERLQILTVISLFKEK